MAAGIVELEARLAAAEALEQAAARWQNARTPGDRTCDAGAAPYFAFADAWRVAAQRARVQSDRVVWLWQAPTLVAVRTEALAKQVDGLTARAQAQGQSWSVFGAWHERFGPSCDPVPPLTEVRPGGPLGDGPTAVWLVSGVLCPTKDAEPGAKLLPRGGLACVAADARCGCLPTAWEPGAVLALPPPTEPPAADAAAPAEAAP